MMNDTRSLNSLMIQGRRWIALNQGERFKTWANSLYHSLLWDWTNKDIAERELFWTVYMASFDRENQQKLNPSSVSCYTTPAKSLKWSDHYHFVLLGSLYVGGDKIVISFLLELYFLSISLDHWIGLVQIYQHSLFQSLTFMKMEFE